MQFSPESILLALFTGIGAGIGAYIAAYMKGKGELKAATEGLATFVDNQKALTRAQEDEKLKIATQGALASETRKCVYALVVACQGLIHSMCWLAWHTKEKSDISLNFLQSYDEEAHKLLPEILAQQTVLAHLDHTLYDNSKECVDKIFSLDLGFGNATILARENPEAAVLRLRELYAEAIILSNNLSETFSQHGVATSRSIEDFGLDGRATGQGLGRKTTFRREEIDHRCQKIFRE
jgi:hypothetical protein